MYGDPKLPLRFWNKVYTDPVTGCWPWQASTNKEGYGQYRIGNYTRLSHKVVFEVLFGPVTPGLELDHLCRSRRCCNPDHLEVVTHAENMRRGLGGKYVRKACRSGHPYVVGSYTTRANGVRNCLACRRATERRRFRARK